jgi:hypothetical protein
VRPKLAALFWCYKHADLCADRLRLLRRHDPDVPVYVLFGGEPEDAPSFERALAPWVDDFYVYTDGPPGGVENPRAALREGVAWKYVFGDLMFSAWHRDRGKSLEWDTVVVVQWDMLVYGRLDDLFRCLKKDEILFSGLRPVSELEQRWVWTSPLAAERAAYTEFLDHVRERYGFDGEPECFVAIVLCLPRPFLDRFCEIERPDLGFLEYRLPVYARVFGTPVCAEHPYDPWLAALERYSLGSTLRAVPQEIFTPTIIANLLRADGARVFHPYYHRAPDGWLRSAAALLSTAGRSLDAVWKWIRAREPAPRERAT